MIVLRVVKNTNNPINWLYQSMTDADTEANGTVSGREEDCESETSVCCICRRDLIHMP